MLCDGERFIILNIPFAALHFSLLALQKNKNYTTSAAESSWGK